MKESLELQPAIEKVNTKIDLNRLNSALSDFEYTSLNGDILI